MLRQRGILEGQYLPIGLVSELEDGGHLDDAKSATRSAKASVRSAKGSAKNDRRVGTAKATKLQRGSNATADSAVKTNQPPARSASKSVQKQLQKEKRKKEERRQASGVNGRILTVLKPSPQPKPAPLQRSRDAPSIAANLREKHEERMVNQAKASRAQLDKKRQQRFAKKPQIHEGWFRPYPQAEEIEDEVTVKGKQQPLVRKGHTREEP